MTTAGASLLAIDGGDPLRRKAWPPWPFYGPDEIEVRLDVAGAPGRSSRIVQLDAAAPVNNIRVIHFGRSDELGSVPLRLKPWDVRWVEIE